MVFVSVILFVLMLVRNLQGTSYEFKVNDPDIFNDCNDQPSNVMNFSALFDTSDLVTVMGENDIVSVYGNLTVRSKWEIGSTDRILVRVSTYHWEVGVWQPTIFNMVYKDFCKLMFDPKQFWYNSWTQYIINANEVKEKCFHYPGTKFYMSSFDFRFFFEAFGPSVSGRFMVEYVLEAFDELNIQRPFTICFVMIGEIIKI